MNLRPLTCEASALPLSYTPTTRTNTDVSNKLSTFCSETLIPNLIRVLFLMFPMFVPPPLPRRFNVYWAGGGGRACIQFSIIRRGHGDLPPPPCDRSWPPLNNIMRSPSNNVIKLASAVKRHWHNRRLVRRFPFQNLLLLSHATQSP